MSTAGNSGKVFSDPSGGGTEKQAQTDESASTEPAETCLLAAELTASCRVRTIKFNTLHESNRELTVLIPS